MVRRRWVKAAVFLLCLLPLARLAWRAWTGSLTANPIEYITQGGIAGRISRAQPRSSPPLPCGLSQVLYRWQRQIATSDRSQIFRTPETVAMTNRTTPG